MKTFLVVILALMVTLNAPALSLAEPYDYELGAPPNADNGSPILVDPDKPFEELFTLPLLPEDPSLSMPEEVKNLLTADSIIIFDLGVVENDLNGYPIPHVKVSFVESTKSEKFIVVMVMALDKELNAPDRADESSILEVKWFSTEPDAINAPTLKLKRWVNYLLIKKILDEMINGGKSNEKITT